MRDWGGAVVVGQGPRWLILLTGTRQAGDGSWRYSYSIAPGVTCTYTTWPGPSMVGPYDDAIISDLTRIAAHHPASAGTIPVPDTGL